MNTANVYVNGTRVATTTTADHTIMLDPAIKVSNGDTIHFTYTTTTGTTTTTGGGEWWPADPDMTDWPADDIIDHYARKLAKKRPA